MPNRIVWEVDLEVIGEIKVLLPIKFVHEKGFDELDQFYSTIQIKNATYGIQASVTAYAQNGKYAREAALLYGLATEKCTIFRCKSNI